MFLIALNITRALYTALVDITMGTESFMFAGIEQALKRGMTTITATLSTVGLLFVLIFEIALGWKCFKLLLVKNGSTQTKCSHSPIWVNNNKIIRVEFHCLVRVLRYALAKLKTVPRRCALFSSRTYRYVTVRVLHLWCMEAHDLKVPFGMLILHVPGNRPVPTDEEVSLHLRGFP